MIQRNIQEANVPAADGSLLKTLFCLPDETAFPCPAVVIRSPYSICSDDLRFTDDFCKNGIAVVLQDCRGTGGSQGEAQYWEQEQADANSLFTFVKNQPWFNGKLVMTGESYSGATQWQAIRNPDTPLTGFAPHNAPLDCFDGIYYPSGAYGFAAGIYWALTQRQQRLHLPDIQFTPELLKHLPLNTFDEAAGVGKWESFRSWLAQPLRNAFWDKCNAFSAISKIKVPAYITGGWFDPFIMQTLRAFTMMRNTAATPEAREYTRLVIEPFNHAMMPGEVNYGKFCRAGIINLRKRFLMNCLNDPEEDPLPDQPPVKLFLMGSNQWVETDQWPLPSIQKNWYLREDQMLSTQPPGDQELPDRFIYDPENPVPTNGGNNLLFLPAGQHKQNELETRSDVLLYTSPELTEDLTIIGAVRAVIYAKTTAPDTDFTVKLCDVYPDGTSYNVCDGLVRASRRNGMGMFAPSLTPDEIVKFDIDCKATALTFQKGHRIRIQVSSSNFPCYDRNPNTGEPFGTATKTQKAMQTILHDGEHPSRLILPEIPVLP
ncbi:MAG: CocE/NonD family hydrolase [Lentisphaeria bacterium]|nr:CocE/NonD family hydrolase [Lentisphaeria bacterium]